MKKVLYSLFNYIVALLFFGVAVSCYAQQQSKGKWKAPKRPKPVKWEMPKQKAPEVIDVWRPYTVADNWFVDLTFGTSVSLTENANNHFIKSCQPSAGFAIGRQFSKVWSTRFDLAYKRHAGWASDEKIAEYPAQLGEGGYCFNIGTAFIDEQLSLTNLFCKYNERRILNINMFLGVGVNYSWGFDKKTKYWERYGYPVEGTDQINLNARGGLQALFKIGEAADIMLQGAYNMVGDGFNGVKDAKNKSFAFDPYVEASIGVRIHLMDHYGDYRYYKVRRSEAGNLRAEDIKIGNYLDNEKLQEFKDREASEVVDFGQLMKTHVSFYIDRAFVNDNQMENLRIVSDFMKKNPNVNIVVRGYCGASMMSESAEMHLAERRAKAVVKNLKRYYNVDDSRIQIWYSEDADAPFPMNGEWIDGVVFQMVRAE